jgi:hypothetical protein
MRTAMLGLGCGLGVVVSLGLAGCLPLGIPGDVARGPDIPVVPLPPPPLGRPAPEVDPSSAPKAPAPGALTPAQLHQRAATRYAGIDSYIARLTSREVVKGERKPEQLMLFKFRKEPWSVYFKWLSKEGQGREVLFVKGHYQNKIHTILSASDGLPFMAGRRMAMDPESVFVRSSSRHPITEAGIGANVERVGQLLQALERGDRRQGTLTLRVVKRPEFAGAVGALEHAIPPGVEGPLPRGGRRLYVFDPETDLPLVIHTHDERRQEVEYYRYDRLQYPVRLDADDFNPDKLWPRPANPGKGAGR